MSKEGSCFYKHTGEHRIVQSGCKPHRQWIPQLDMTYCPFCGHEIKLLRIATSKEMPSTPTAS